ncbi:MAG: hypothetical protein KGP29_07665 [Proteobacteria bacterium]|nr:hypothetical protein [Pseudomonadota bacterium]
MEIESVKEFKESYLVNQYISVPKNSDNSDYQRVQQWIANGGVVEQEDLLAKTKLEKIAKIKSIRDQKNIEPITDQQAFIIDENGTVTSQESYFVFYTNRHQTNPASDPEAIISRAIVLGAMPYFTKDNEGKQITIELTAEIATILRQKISERNDSNYKLSSTLEAEILSAESVEEVEAISNQILNQ